MSIRAYFGHVAMHILIAICIGVSIASGAVPTTHPSTTRAHRVLGPPWRDESKLEVPEWKVTGEAHIAVLNPHREPGEKLRLQLEFANTGRKWAFYDLILSDRLVPPLVIAMYSPQTKEPTGTILLSMPNGFLNSAPQDWINLPSQARLSQVLNIWAPKSGYLIQIIFTPDFVRPSHGTLLPDDLPDNPESLQKDELFRTNAVLVE